MTVYLDEYKTFTSTQELNHNVSQHEKAHIDALNASCRTVLRFIARYSVKYAGASHLKAQTIADALDVSDRTVRRILKRLEGLDIIHRIHRLRPKTGGHGANIMQILPHVSVRLSEREVDAKARPATGKATDSDKEPLRKLDLHTYVLDTGADKNNIPQVLKDALAPFYRGAQLRKYVGIVLRAKTPKVRLEAHTEAFKACIGDCVRRYKLGQVANIDGYLYASIRKLSRGLFMGLP